MQLSKIKNIFQAFHFEIKTQPINLNLPVIFQRRYEFLTVEINKKIFLLIKEKRTGNIENFVKQAKAIQKQMNREVILVFKKLADTDKKKLLQVGMPYLDYQENAYLPQLGFLFSKTSDEIEINQSLSSTEQKVLITLLLHASSLVIDLEKISKATQLSVPSLYRIFKKFKERGWLINKLKSYQFAKKKSEVFHEAKKFLKNPIKTTVIITDEDFNKLKKQVEMSLSSLPALSSISMLANSANYGNYALSKKQYKKIEKELTKNIFEGHCLEIWNYAPIFFEYERRDWFEWNNDDFKVVDPISLYLILKDEEEPRIEEEVKILQQKILKELGG